MYKKKNRYFINECLACVKGVIEKYLTIRLVIRGVILDNYIVY